MKADLDGSCARRFGLSAWLNPSEKFLPDLKNENESWFSPLKRPVVENYYRRVVGQEQFIRHGGPFPPGVGIEHDDTRPGRKPKISARKVKAIVARTTQQQPDNAPHWSTRTMAAVVGVSAASVRSIWQAHGLKPHRMATFKVSNDKHFTEKLEDIVGLYLDPPEQALVFCCDEKSQIQALDRTQPGLPMKRGHCQTMTHDYMRNGVTTLFAAMSTLDGNVIGQCMTKHRHQEWLAI